MENPSYAIPQAMCQLSSWLSAVGIPHKIQDERVSVTDRDQKNVEVSFVSNPEQGARLCYSGDQAKVEIDREKFIAHTDSGYDVGDAQEVFAELQVALGYEPKVPVDRGVEASNVRSNGSFGEDTVFRHREFRRAPNLKASDYQKYKSVITKAVRIFQLRWSRLMSSFSIEEDDLRQYCLVWITSFIALYERPDLSEQENIRLCYTYLSQRFVELKGWLTKRARNSRLTSPSSFSSQETYANQEGEIFDGGRVDSGIMDTVMYPERYLAYPLHPVEPPPEDLQYRARKALYTTNVCGTVRRRVAREVLEQLLNGLSHEEYIEKLSAAAMNPRGDIEARLEAVEQLRKHARNCQGCSEYVEVLAVKVHEDIARADPFGT